MNYRVAKNKETGKFEVLEIKTEQVVFDHANYDIASQVYKDLNHNHLAFDGWTPSFFLRRINLNKFDTHEGVT